MLDNPLLPQECHLTGILVVCLLATALVPLAAANEVLKWNETALKAVTAGGQNLVQVTCTIAMVQGPVHDALNAINRRYAAYYFEEPVAPGASPDAAVATATHTVLVGVLPSFGTPAQKTAALAIVEETYLAALSRGSDAPTKTSGVAVGRAAGAAMLALRKDDGALRDAPHTPGTGPGKWRPHPTPTREPTHRQRGTRPRLCVLGPPRLGQHHAFHAAVRRAVLAPCSSRADERELRLTAIREGDTDGNPATTGDPIGTDQVAFTTTSGPPFGVSLPVCYPPCLANRKGNTGEQRDGVYPITRNVRGDALGDRQVCPASAQREQ